MKKFLSLFLSLVISLSVFFGGTVTAGAETYGVLTYELKDGKITITGCDENASGEVVIPAEIDGYPVTSIGRNAFSGCTGLTSITIPDCVISIGDWAFGGCTGLESITVDEGNPGYHSSGNCLIETESKTLIAGCKNSVIPDDGSVTSIGRSAFFGCTGLTSVTIPDSVTYIANYAFSGCAGLTGINIPDSVTSISDYAFQSCSGLTIITIPDSVTNIGDYAFAYCSGLTSVTIPDSVTSIGWYAFSGCTGLTSVNIPNKVESIGIGTFEGCTGLTSITIPGSVTSIGNDAFSRCTGLTSITIPDSVTSIGDRAFSGCTGLTSVTIPDSITSIGSFAFYDCSGLTSITIPGSVTSIGWYAFSGCTGLTSVTIPGSVTSIGNDAFSRCTGLTSITIPDSVTSIGEGAFAGCTGLTSITIPDSVTSIGWYAFSGCAGLTSVNIPNKLESIGIGTFEGCTGLTSVTIPDSVTSISNGAFRACTGLTSITIPNSVTSIGEEAFFGCTGLESITVDEGNPVYHSSGNCLIETESKEMVLGCKNSVIPDDGSVTSIGEEAFYYCTGLTGIIIPNSVTIIDRYAFYECTGLTSITIPDSVTSIGEWAFEYCTGLTSITIPDSVTSIGGAAFGGCTGLTSINIPNSVTSIGYHAFSECTGLESITVDENNPVYHSSGNCLIETESKELVLGCKNSVIPGDGTVTSIGVQAFSVCTGLTSITIPDSVTSIGEGAFYYCTGLASVSIPDSITSIGDYAFFGCFGLTSITIPDSVTNIGEEAFEWCAGLESVTIGKGVTSIGDGVFNYCIGLTSVTIPDSVTSIGSFAFNLHIDEGELPEVREEYEEAVAAGEQYVGFVPIEVVKKVLEHPESSLNDVFYRGTQEQWEAIEAGEINNDLFNATIHYNYKDIVFESPEGVVLYDDYSAKIPDGRVIENAIDLSVGGNNVKFNLNQLTPQENDGFNAIEYGCACKFDLSLDDPDGTGISEDNPATIRFKKGFIGNKKESVVIFHLPERGGKDSFTFSKEKPESKIYDDGEYWKITVTSLSPFGIYYLPTLNVKASQTVDYKANVTVTATADNVPEGYVLAIYEGNTLREKGSNTSVSYKAGTMTANRTFTVKVIDSGNNALKDIEENEIKANCEVKVNSGFFAKLIAFFKGLFGALPNVEVKP